MGHSIPVYDTGSMDVESTKDNSLVQAHLKHNKPLA